VKKMKLVEGNFKRGEEGPALGLVDEEV